MSGAKYDFSDKVAFVTGGASGIGRATVERFAQAGASVVVADRNAEAAAALCAALANAGGEIIAVALDVTDRASVASAVEQTIKQFGRIDFAVNSAGIASGHARVPDIDPEEWRRIFAINVEGVFLCMQAELTAMEKRGFGAIVNMSSGAGLNAVPLMSSYCASKHAVLGLTRSAALEYVDKNIRINAICPAAVATPMVLGMNITAEQRKAIDDMHPMHRIARPEEVAAMILFACSDEASYSTGVEFRVNGGTGI